MTTTDQIRRAVSASGWRDCGGAEGFDAWLAAHDREVQARALQEAEAHFVLESTHVGPLSARGDGMRAGLRRAADYLNDHVARLRTDAAMGSNS